MQTALRELKKELASHEASLATVQAKVTAIRKCIGLLEGANGTARSGQVDLLGCRDEPLTLGIMEGPWEMVPPIPKPTAKKKGRKPKKGGIRDEITALASGPGWILGTDIVNALTRDGRQRSSVCTELWKMYKRGGLERKGNPGGGRGRGEGYRYRVNR